MDENCNENNVSNDNDINNEKNKTNIIDDDELHKLPSYKCIIYCSIL